MIIRTMDPTYLNSVANHPDVRPWIGGDGPIDMSALIANPENIALQAEHGGFLLLKLEPTIYEVHTMFLPEGRGKWLFAALDAGSEYVFAATDALEVVTQVPTSNDRARMLSNAGHFKPTFSRARCWPSPGGPDGIDYFGLTIERWMFRAECCLDAGHGFHDDLERLTNHDFPPHHDDGDAHDRVAGACYLMALAGNGLKAAETYNRWARLAGYPLVTVLSLHPLIMDVGEGVIVEHYQGSMRLLQLKTPIRQPVSGVCYANGEVVCPSA